MNDFAVGTDFASIEVDSGAYGFTGSPIHLDRGIKATYASGVSTCAIDTQLNGDQTIEVDGGGLDLSGVISDVVGIPSGVTKTGSGSLELAGNSTYTGTTTVGGGLLNVDGNISTSRMVVVNNTAGGLLGGGTVPGVVVAGAQLKLGTNPGILTAGSVTLDSASTFSVGLAGRTAGSGYSQLIAGAAVSLGGASLDVNVGYTPAPGDQFTSIRNAVGTLSVTPTSATHYVIVGIDGGVAGAPESFTVTAEDPFKTSRPTIAARSTSPAMTTWPSFRPTPRSPTEGEPSASPSRRPVWTR